MRLVLLYLFSSFFSTEASSQIPVVYVSPHAMCLQIQGYPFPNNPFKNEWQIYGRNDYELIEFSGLGVLYKGIYSNLNFLLSAYAESASNWNSTILLGVPLRENLRSFGGLTIAAQRPESTIYPDIRLGWDYVSPEHWFFGQGLIMGGQSFTLSDPLLRFYTGRDVSAKIGLMGEAILYSNHFKVTFGMRIALEPWVIGISTGLAPSRLGFVLERRLKKGTLISGLSHHAKLGASPVSGFIFQNL